MNKVTPEDIEFNEAENRFTWTTDGKTAYAEFMLIKGVRIIMKHTEVPVGLEGQGVGSALARAAFAFAKDHDLKVMPLCPFMAGYMKRKPEYHHLLMDGFSL